MSSGCGCQHRHSDCGAPGTVPLCQRRRRDSAHQLVSPIHANPRLQPGTTDPAKSLFSLFNRHTGSNPFDVTPKGRPPVKEKKDSFLSIGFGRPGSSDCVTKFATTNKLKTSDIAQGALGAAAAAASIGDSVFRFLGRAVAGVAGPPPISGGEGFSSQPPSSSIQTTSAEPGETSAGVIGSGIPNLLGTGAQLVHTTSSSASKYLLILGDDPKQKNNIRNTSKYQKKRKQPQLRRGGSLQKKQKSIYNYYASGSGWWDSNMEGIDSEEVGFNEVWEGMGSTTIGGLEWH